MSTRQSPQMFVRKTVNDTLVTSIPPHSNFLRRSPRRHFPPSLRSGKKPTYAAAVLTVLAEMADPPLAHRVGGAGVVIVYSASSGWNTEMLLISMGHFSRVGTFHFHPVRATEGGRIED